MLCAALLAQRCSEGLFPLDPDVCAPSVAQATALPPAEAPQAAAAAGASSRQSAAADKAGFSAAGAATAADARALARSLATTAALLLAVHGSDPASVTAATEGVLAAVRGADDAAAAAPGSGDDGSSSSSSSSSSASLSARSADSSRPATLREAAVVFAAAAAVTPREVLLACLPRFLQLVTELGPHAPTPGDSGPSRSEVLKGLADAGAGEPCGPGSNSGSTSSRSATTEEPEWRASLRRLLRLLAGHALRQPSALPGETHSGSIGSAMLQLARDSAGAAAELLATPGSAAGAGVSQARRVLLRHLDSTVLPHVRAFCASHRAAVAAYVVAQGTAAGIASGAGAGSAETAAGGAGAASPAAAVGSPQGVLVVLPKQPKLLAIVAQRAQARVAGAEPSQTVPGCAGDN
jgi:hypothetical protein